MSRRFYYYTGPLGDDCIPSPADEAQAKAIVRELHFRRQAIEAGREAAPDAVVRRIDKELNRRRIAAEQALMRVLKCSEAELASIHITVFDGMPTILALEGGAQR